MEIIDPTPSTRIFVVRHGESGANKHPDLRSKICEARIDLTPLGWDQALGCGQFFAGYLAEHPPAGKVAMLHGSLNRLRETGQGIREGIPDRIDHYQELDELNELNFGLAGDKAKNGWQEQFPEYEPIQKRFADGKAIYFFRFPNGESREDVERRCHLVADQIHYLRTQGFTDFVVVTSSIPARVMVKELLGLPYEDLDNEPSPHNCDVRLIENGVDKGYIYSNGKAQDAATHAHESDKQHFEKGDYFPPFVRGAMPTAAQPLATAHL